MEVFQDCTDERPMITSERFSQETRRTISVGFEKNTIQLVPQQSCTEMFSCADVLVTDLFPRRTAFLVSGKGRRHKQITVASQQYEKSVARFLQYQEYDIKSRLQMLLPRQGRIVLLSSLLFFSQFCHCD